MNCVFKFLQTFKLLFLTISMIDFNNESQLKKNNLL